MFMFSTYRPETLDEALEIIHKETCHIFAGGTDLMIRKRQWQGAERKFTQPVVYINHLKALKNIEDKGDYYQIGALTTQSDMVHSMLPDYIRVPYEQMSSPAIRNVATVGGNIVNAASVADSLPILYALNASVVLRSLKGQRTLPIEVFIQNKYKTALESFEILTHVLIPKFSHTHFKYKKIGQRKASILSKVSVFMVYNEKDLRIAIGAVNDKVIRERSIEEAYLANENLNKLLMSYKQLLDAKDDKRSTKQYKEQVVLNLLEYFLKEKEDGL